MQKIFDYYSENENENDAYYSKNISSYRTKNIHTISALSNTLYEFLQIRINTYNKEENAYRFDKQDNNFRRQAKFR